MREVHSRKLITKSGCLTCVRIRPGLMLLREYSRNAALQTTACQQLDPSGAVHSHSLCIHTKTKITFDSQPMPAARLPG